MKRILAVLTLISSPALAQQGMPDLGEMFFKQFDSNGDGQVSKAEFMQPTEAQFDHMDKNADGSLDSTEVEAFNDEMQRRMQEMQQRLRQGGQQGMPPR